MKISGKIYFICYSVVHKFLTIVIHIGKITYNYQRGIHNVRGPPLCGIYERFMYSPIIGNRPLKWHCRFKVRSFFWHLFFYCLKICGVSSDILN